MSKDANRCSTALNHKLDKLHQQTGLEKDFLMQTCIQSMSPQLKLLFQTKTQASFFEKLKKNIYMRVSLYLMGMVNFASLKVSYFFPF